MVQLAINTPDANQTAVPSSSSSGTFSPNSDPGLPTATFHNPHNNHNNHNNHRSPSQPPPVQSNSGANAAVNNGAHCQISTVATQMRSRSADIPPQQPPPPPPPLLTNGHGLYIPYVNSEFYTADQGYFMPQDLCPAHASICLHSEFGKNHFHQ